MFRKMREIWHNDMKGFSARRALQLDRLNAWCQNEMLMRQKIDFNSFYMYRYASMLHEILRLHDPVGNGKFIRIGGENDGGYVMWKPLSDNNIAYSFGISDDVSWDLQMVNLGYEVYQYDHTIDALPIQNKHFHYKKIGIVGG